jgi:hypothetical protein
LKKNCLQERTIDLPLQYPFLRVVMVVVKAGVMIMLVMAMVRAMMALVLEMVEMVVTRW